MFQILDRVEKSEQERAAPSSAAPSEHDVEIDHFSNYLKAQMKKIPNPKWMDFTMDTMMLGKKFVYGEEPTPPIPTASSSPINVVDDKDEVVPPQPTQVTTMANLNVVPSSTSHNLSSYLATLGTPAIPQPLYGDYLSPSMALMGSPSVQHLMKGDLHALQADKMN